MKGNKIKAKELVQPEPKESKTLTYKEYLQTNHWKQIRKKALKFAKYRCQLCNSNNQLHTHHRSYVNLGCEKPKDVIVLCSECHGKFHDILTHTKVKNNLQGNHIKR